MFYDMFFNYFRQNWKYGHWPVASPHHVFIHPDEGKQQPFSGRISRQQSDKSTSLSDTDVHVQRHTDRETFHSVIKTIECIYSP